MTGGKHVGYVFCVTCLCLAIRTNKNTLIFIYLYVKMVKCEQSMWSFDNIYTYIGSTPHPGYQWQMSRFSLGFLHLIINPDADWI